MENGYPIGYEKMTPVQRALEIALHALVTLDGLHVTDIPDVEYTWDIDNTKEIEIIENILNTTDFTSTANMDSVQGDS